MVAASAHTAVPPSAAAGGTPPAARRTTYPATPESASLAAGQASCTLPVGPICGVRRAAARRRRSVEEHAERARQHAGLGRGVARQDGVVVRALGRGRVGERRHRARRRGEQPAVAVDVVVRDGERGGRLPREGRRGRGGRWRRDALRRADGGRVDEHRHGIGRRHVVDVVVRADDVAVRPVRRRLVGERAHGRTLRREDGCRPRRRRAAGRSGRCHRRRPRESSSSSGFRQPRAAR